ncbi:MAG: hypothetical protein H7842_00070 [Gammaproteobacteria bacterium SHHR-1]|uniref:hypothetical protein n=1 Tax=Magnetovirga frankeli TaxID=947516 RepID=UPI0012934501|nr:hypothetical protein D5125_16525 [gamma proteobacterium SS-5]
MNAKPFLEAEKTHLAQLLEAIQRCTYYLHATTTRLEWPLEGQTLEFRKKDSVLFEALAAFNERFAKLQDTLGAAMRHASLLLGESTESFLKVLAYYEKAGVVDSIETWQALRTVRNLAAHSYETDYAAIAEHFNTLHEMVASLYQTAGLFIDHCENRLGVCPEHADFEPEFRQIAKVSSPR